MLTIRLSRHGRNKRPYFRIVLTEHTKPAKWWYQDVLGWYDPIKHILEANVDAIKHHISNGSQVSERVAKLLYAKTKDTLFQKFFVQRERTGQTKNVKS